MQIIRGWCRLVFVVVLIAGWTLFTAFGLLLKPSSDRPRYRAQRQRKGCLLACWATGFRVTATGELPSSRPMLYVSNHITAIDPVLAGTHVEVGFAGKMEITRWPVLGWIANCHGIIGVDRSRRSFTLQLIESMRKRLGEGIPVMVFPEGGIGWGDVLLPFKTGVFEAVAGNEALEILPLFVHVAAIDGKEMVENEGRYALSHKHHPRLFIHMAHLFSHRRIDIELRFGSPFPVESMNRKGLAETARSAVEALM